MTTSSPVLERDRAASRSSVVQRLWAVVAGVAVVCGVGLRWYRLGSQSLWFDEGYTAWVAALSPGQIVGVIRADTAPPLYYLLLHGWAMLAGHSEAGLRSLSALACVAGLGVAVMVACRLFTRPAARGVAVVAVAFSSMQVGYAHEARFYECMSLAGIVDFYLVLRACEPEAASAGWLAATAVSLGVGLWLNNLMVIYTALLGAAWLVMPGRRPVRGRLRDASIVMAAAVLAYSPWIAAARAQAAAVGGQFWIARPIGHDLLRLLAQTAGVDHAGEHLLGRQWFDALVVLVGLLVFAATAWGRRWRVGAALAIYGVLPVVVVFAFSLVARPLFIDRAFIVSSLVTPLLVAVPLEAMPAIGSRLLRGSWRGVTALLVTVFLIAGVRSSLSEREGVVYHSEAWREAAGYVGRLAAGKRTLIVFNANEGELLYDFYARHGDYAPRADVTGTPADFFAARPPRTLQRVASEGDLAPLRQRLALAGGEAVVLVTSHERALPEGPHFTLDLLQQLRRPLSRRAFGDIVVTAFAAEQPASRP